MINISLPDGSVRSFDKPVSGAAIAASYREHPQTLDDNELAMASAIALTEAEPW